MVSMRACIPISNIYQIKHLVANRNFMNAVVWVSYISQAKGVEEKWTSMINFSCSWIIYVKIELLDYDDYCDHKELS